MGFPQGMAGLFRASEQAWRDDTQGAVAQRQGRRHVNKAALMKEGNLEGVLSAASMAWLSGMMQD
jgi:hypothetical protein